MKGYVRASVCVLWKIVRDGDKEGNGVIFFGHACVFVCVKEREKSVCGGLINTEGDCACICVCMCVSSSAQAVSLILHAHREEDDRRVHSRRRACYADCNFRPRNFFLFFF